MGSQSDQASERQGKNGLFGRGEEQDDEMSFSISMME